MSKTVTVGGRPIGGGHQAFVVVELGVCHEQNVELAERFIERAAEAEADAVKVESFQADELVVDRTVMHTYGTAAGQVRENYYDLLKRLELSLEDHARLKRKADRCGILFFPTVATNRAADFFDRLDVCAFKLASPDVTNYPLQRHLASLGRPVFLDTGGSFIHEVERAVINLNQAGLDQVIIMHNPSGYPAPPEKTDLRMITTLRQVFDAPVGLSCHTPGCDVIMAALALGAEVIEKPVTRDRTIAGPEHVFSLLEGELGEFMTRVRALERSLGSGRRTEVEEMSLPRFIGRRGVYAARDLAAGEVLDSDAVILAKPNRGISVVHLDLVLGRRLRRPVAKHQPVTWEVV